MYRGEWFAAIALGVAVASLGGPLLARAYNNFDNISCRWSNPDDVAIVYWKDDPSYPPSGDYVSAFSQARASWNNAATSAIFVPTASNYTWGVRDYGDTSGNLLGFVSGTCSSNNPWNYYNLYANSGELDSDAQWTHIFYKQLVGAHEGGHVIALGHSAVTPAVMHGGPTPGFRLTPYPGGAYNGPLADDECGVNTMYASMYYPPSCGY